MSVVLEIVVQLPGVEDCFIRVVFQVLFWLFCYNWLAFDEKLEPFSPISLVDVFLVSFLLVYVSFICYVKDCIEEDFAHICTPFSMSLLLKDSHVVISLSGHLNIAFCLFLHLDQLLLFASLGVSLVDLSPFLISNFSQLPVFRNDALALVGSPLFVEQLVLLLGFLLHPLDNLVLAVLVLHFHQSFGLINNLFPPASFPVFLGTVGDRAFLSLFGANASHGHSSKYSCRFPRLPKYG